MSGFDTFLGNEQLISRLERDISSGRMAHAYIIEGAKGCGKRTLAKLICCALSCSGSDVPCMKCISCDKIGRDQSPDVTFVLPDKGRVQLGVDVIRRLREDAVFAPIDLAKKFYIIPDAESMNDQAQNALLKILEEPPAHVMFLILTSSADELLSTVRSRAPVLRVEALSDELVAERLKATDEAAQKLAASDPDAFGAAIKLSRGSLGRAAELVKNSSGEAFALYKTAEQYMELISTRKNAMDDVSFYEFASKLTGVKQREEFAAVVSLLADAARDLVNAKLTNNPTPMFYTSADKAFSLASRFTLSKLMALTDIFCEVIFV